MQQDFQNRQDKRFAQAAVCLSPRLYKALIPYFERFENSAQEIRLRLGRPLLVQCPDKAYYVTEEGLLTAEYENGLLCCSEQEMAAVFESLCGYSVYAKQDEILGGFITVDGGHRAGICGTAVTDSGKITNVRRITSINLRIAREHRECARPLYEKFADASGGLLICGAPCSGKTTVLRDLARLLSFDYSVSLIDERGELAGCTNGAFQNDIGLCDVFDGYPKAEAMLQALRSMSPRVIMCDEIGGEADVAALKQCVNSGVRVIATMHAGSIVELKNRPVFQALTATGVFSDLVFLSDRYQAGCIEKTVGIGDLVAA